MSAHNKKAKEHPRPKKDIKFYAKNHKGGVPISEYNNALAHYNFAYAQLQDAKAELKERYELSLEKDKQITELKNRIAELLKRAEPAMSGGAASNNREAVERMAKILCNFPMNEQREILFQLNATIILNWREVVDSHEKKMNYALNNLTILTAAFQELLDGKVVGHPKG